MRLDELRTHAWEGRKLRLTVLVGSNPLPNLIAALALAPAELVLVCSQRTAGPARLLVDCLKARLPNATFLQFDGLDWLLLPDAHKASQIRSAVGEHARALAEGVLFYTGGTKAMATHVHHVLSSEAADRQRRLRACYLADATGKLLFDDGYECSVVENVGTTLKELAVLHGMTGLTFKSPGLGSTPGTPTDSDAELLRAETFRNPAFAGGLFRALTIPETGNPAKVSQLGQLREPPLLPLPQMPHLPPSFSLETGISQLSNSRGEPWVKFLRGIWLEVVVARLLADVFPPRETARSVKGALSSGRDFDLDVAQLAGPRLYAVSCTIGSDQPKERGHTKLKLFEVAHRAKQIGGDLARSAVVSLHSQATCRELESEIAAVWSGDEPQPRVFGIDDLRQWSSGGHQPLVAWLRS